MTSASKPAGLTGSPAALGSARIEALAERIAANWEHHTHPALTA